MIRGFVHTLFVATSWTIVCSAVVAQAPRRPNFGSGALAVTGNFATADAKTRRLAVTLLIANTGTEPLRLFLASQISASDNSGNVWSETPFQSRVTGIHICDSGSYCLSRDREATEQSSTLLDPGGVMTVILTMSPQARAGANGDLVNVGFNPMVQTVREVVGPNGPRLEGGSWSTRSLGAANISLRWAP